MQAPQNVEVRVLNSTNIKVSFDPPDQQMIPGVNLGYKIELWKGTVGVGIPYKRYLNIALCNFYHLFYSAFACTRIQRESCRTLAI